MTKLGTLATIINRYCGQCMCFRGSL